MLEAHDVGIGDSQHDDDVGLYVWCWCCTVATQFYGGLGDDVGWYDDIGICQIRWWCWRICPFKCRRTRWHKTIWWWWTIICPLRILHCGSFTRQAFSECYIITGEKSAKVLSNLWESFVCDIVEPVRGCTCIKVIPGKYWGFVRCQQPYSGIHLSNISMSLPMDTIPNIVSHRCSVLIG